jgi:hypothetical protein
MRLAAFLDHILGKQRALGNLANFPLCSLQSHFSAFTIRVVLRVGVNRRDVGRVVRPRRVRILGGCIVKHEELSDVELEAVVGGMGVCGKGKKREEAAPAASECSSGC